MPTCSRVQHLSQFVPKYICIIAQTLCPLVVVLYRALFLLPSTLEHLFHRFLKLYGRIASMVGSASAQGGPQADCEALAGTFSTGGGKPTCTIGPYWYTEMLVPGTLNGGSGDG